MRIRRATHPPAASHQRRMMDAQLDLPFFQALFLGGIVVNIRVADIVRLAEEALALGDDFLGEFVELSVVVADQPSINSWLISVILKQFTRPFP